jgi:oligopeptide transport system permease protein
MTRFLLSRLLQTLLALFVIVTATFFMPRLAPGGPFTSERVSTPEIEARKRAYYNLDKPLWRQYRDYMVSVLPKTLRPAALFPGDGAIDLKAGLGIDFGPSFKYPNRTVNEIIAAKLPVSLALGLPSLLIALGAGVTLGILAALRRNTWLDYLASALGMVGLAVPTFIIGPVFVLVFALALHWFNASGWYGWRDAVLPCLVLGLAYAAPIVRLTRGGMLEILNQDFIRTARAKGATETRVVLRHALRGGLLPVVAYLGPATANILTGSFVVETIFQIPGLGREFVNSALNRDYFLILGTVILYAALIMALNLAVDIAQAWMNPKVRLEN